MPKISICIPCYHAPEKMERLLASVARQTERDYEVCIADDSTDDATAEVVRRMERAFPAGTIRYVRNEKPLGPVLNWNASLRLAAGEYIKPLFHDDWFAEADSLRRFAELLDGNPEAALAFSGSHQVLLDNDPEALRCVGDIGKYTERRDGMPSFARHAEDDFVRKLRGDVRRLFLSNQIGAPSAVICRRFDPPILFDEEERGYPSDFLWYLRILTAHPQFAWTKEPLVCIGVHAGQYSEAFSARDERVYQSFRRIYTEHDLRTSAACREYMAREFVAPYRKGLGEARALGIPGGLYLRERFRIQRETVRCFVRARLSRRDG